MSSERIVLVDSQALFREGLKCLLQQNGFTVIGEAENARAAVSVIEETEPAIVLSDISFAVGTGMDLAATIKKSRPGIRLAFVTERDVDAYVLSSMRNGAEGYFLKQDGFSVLLEGIRKIAVGDTAYAPSIASRLSKICRDFVSNPATLSDREIDVLRAYAEGKTTAEVAQSLGISPKTVDSYRSHIALKLNLRTHEYARYAVENGLVDFKRVA